MEVSELKLNSPTLNIVRFKILAIFMSNDFEMTPEDKIQFDQIHEMVSNLIKTQNESNRDTAKRLDVLQRGLYGDPDNESPGLLKRVSAIEKLNLAYEKRFEEVERGNWKNSVKITVGATVISFIVTMVTKLFK